MKGGGAWRVSLYYAGFGETWIILSSILVWIQAGEPPTLSSFLEVGKGTLFILITTALLLTMLRRWEKEIDRRDADLRQSEARYRLLHESLRDGFVQVALNGHYLDCNTVFCDMVGYTKDELLQLSYHDLTPLNWRELDVEIVTKQILVRGYSDVFEKEYRRKDGTLVPAELRAILVRDEAGKPNSIYSIVRDTSERHAQEARATAVREQLIHVGRVQELGQVSAGIAHELNQPLAAMQNYSSAAKRMIERGDSTGASQAIAKACEQATRAGDIIQRMRSFVEKRDTNKKLDNVNAIIRESVALGMIGAKAVGIETHYSYAPDLPPVLVDRVQIEQVLVNLLHNATDAMANMPRRVLNVSSGWNDNAVEIVVADTGPGIPAEILDTLFQPFVTTKEHGMGIGLSISKSIIEAHGGEIFAQPNPGGGTCFYVRLPPELPKIEG